MHIKRRGSRAMLYRSAWVPKGTNGNTHGYATQTFVGSLALDAERLPADIADKFTRAEVTYLENKLFEPARLAAQEKARAAESREGDAIWRLDEAARLVLEAANRSERGAVATAKVSAVHAALSRVRTIGQTFASPQIPAPLVQACSNDAPKADPLRDALLAIKAARDAVFAGKYGRAPAEGVRSTYPYRVWADILQAVEGSSDDSLMRALQSRGFAKTRGK
jgi:hypothetical protein